MRLATRTGGRLMARADISRLDSYPDHARSFPDDRFRDRDHPRMHRFGGTANLCHLADAVVACNALTILHGVALRRMTARQFG